MPDRRRRRAFALLAALLVAATMGVVHPASGEDTAGMACCAGSDHCTMPVLTGTCCSDAPLPGMFVQRSPASVKPTPTDCLHGVLKAATTSLATTAAATASFEHARLRLPHDSPYLKNASLRI